MKYAILSTDATKEYYELLPLVCYSWRKIGYMPVVIVVNVPAEVAKVLEYNCGQCYFVNIAGETGVKDSTIAQISRLVAHLLVLDDAIHQIFQIWEIKERFLHQNDTLITADADMVIAKDIFTHEGDIVSYGFDLTGRSELPICYVKATAAKWRELMGEFNIPPKAYSDKWEDYWSVDQQLLTQRANEYGMNRITFVDRGNQNKHGLPTGRWDRYDWAHIPDDIIDVHMKRNDWDAQIQVFQRLWPGEDYSFILKFKDELAAIQH